MQAVSNLIGIIHGCSEWSYKVSIIGVNIIGLKEDEKDERTEKRIAISKLVYYYKYGNS